jgi:hypothetical protein
LPGERSALGSLYPSVARGASHHEGTTTKLRTVMMRSVETVALVGDRVIGLGWATRCLAYGLDVVVTAPRPAPKQRFVTQ